MSPAGHRDAPDSSCHPLPENESVRRWSGGHGRVLQRLCLVTWALASACGGQARGAGTIRSCGAPLPASESVSGRQVIQSAHGGPVTLIAVSKRGYVATASQFDNTVRIWDLKSRSLLAIVQAQPDDLTWNDDAQALVLHGAGKEPRTDLFPSDLWIAPDGHEIGSRKGDFSASQVQGNGATSPDGRLTAVATHESLTVREVTSGKILWTEDGAPFDPNRDYGPRPGFWGVRLAYDGHTLIAPLTDGSIVLRDLETGRDLGFLGHAVHRPERISWVDDAHVIASDERSVSVWDLATGTMVSSFTEPTGFVTATVLDGDVLVAHMTNCLGGKQATTIAWIDRWDGATSPRDHLGAAPRLRDGCSTAAGLAWPPDKGISVRPLLLGSAGSQFDLRSGNSLVRLVDGTVKRLEGYVQPRGSGDEDIVVRRHFVFANLGRSVGVWSTDGTRLHELTVSVPDYRGAEQRGGRLLGVSEDGAAVALQNQDRVVVFGAATGAEITSTRLGDAPTAIAFRPDPKDVWLGTRGGSVVHLLPSGLVHTVPVETGAEITKLAVAPNGKRFVASLGDGGLRVLHATGELAATLVEFADEEPIAYTPNGAYGGSGEAADRVGWRFRDPIEIFRFEQFAERFRRPDLVAARLSGAPDDVPGKLVRPPSVRLLASATSVSTAAAHIEVRATSTRRVHMVRAYREGREVAAASLCAATGKVALTVPLLAANNTISIQAFDDLGYASNEVVTTIRRTGGPRPALYLVAVGVGAYPGLGKDSQLPLAAGDASAIAAAFRGEVGPGKTFAALDAQLLVDEKATVTSVLAAIDKLSAMKPDDLAIVFFAGHGVKPTPQEDMLFLTGSVASTEAADLRVAGIGWTALAQRLARAKGRVIVLLDACNSGHISQKLVVPNDRLAAALVNEKRAGVIVFAASKGRQWSYEPESERGIRLAPAGRLGPPRPPLDSSKRHGFFTDALLSSLRDRASDRNGDGVLEMSEWIAATSARVERATEGLQTPWLARREMFGDFVVVRLP
jgi:uncharacterized caspase-like protein